VVDDQPDVLSFMAFNLEGAGFEVRVAANGRQAIDVQHEYAADVVVTDIFMPDMDGLELIDRIHYEYPRTRIVAISSGAARKQDYLKIARMIGADATLPKPFSNAELLRLVLAVAFRGTPPGA
jgi:CheY-like chemotaxis protein